MPTKKELEAQLAALTAQLAAAEALAKAKGVSVALQSLVGLHTLDAVDFGNVDLPRWEGAEDTESAAVMWFRLDGKVYGCLEDPSDGYRSSMRDLVLWDRAMENVFPPCQVLICHRDKRKYDDVDLLEALDVVTGKPVLECGTDNSDSYYPSYVASFTPENMAANRKPEEPTNA